MIARRTLQSVALATAAACLFIAATHDQGATATAERPNIVLILLDDADVRDFAMYEPESAIAMPTIEALAKTSEIFDQFYASAPVCSPTRAAILTGQVPARYGINGIIRRTTQQGIPARAPMLAQALRERGYATAHLGKWHLGTQRPEYLPKAKGFEHTLTTGTWRGYNRTAVFVNDTPRENPAGQHLTERITDEAIAYVRAHRNERFFLNLWYFAPHVPLQPPDEWAKLHPPTPAGRYAAMLGYLDQQIGRVLSEIDELGLAPRTAILISSDNGGAQASHNTRGQTLRGYKKDLYEGGIRSPLLIRWPGRSQAGARNPSVTATHDLFPTILELLGDDPGASPLPPFDGESFAASLGGTSFQRAHPLIWQFKLPGGALPQAAEAAKYMSLFAVRDGSWKLVLDDRKLSLFDLAADPREQSNLAAAQPDVTARLLRAYDDWRTTKAQLPVRITATAEPVGVDGNAVQFKGPGAARLDVGAPFDREATDFSCRFGLQLQRTKANQKILGRDSAWQLSVDRKQRLVVQVTGDAGKTESWPSDLTLLPEREYDVAVTFVELGPDLIARVFVDGELAVFGRTKTRIAPSPAPLELGADGPRHLLGRVDRLTCFALGLTLNDL